MTKQDSNDELHPAVPHAFKGGIFLVLVKNDKTSEIEKLEAFEREVNALDYAESFDKSKSTATIHLVQVH